MDLEWLRILYPKIVYTCDIQYCSAVSAVFCDGRLAHERGYQMGAASVIILGKEQQEENHARMAAVRSDFASQCCRGMFG